MILCLVQRLMEEVIHGDQLLPRRRLNRNLKKLFLLKFLHKRTIIFYKNCVNYAKWPVYQGNQTLDQVWMVSPFYYFIYLFSYCSNGVHPFL